jgi:5-methylthioadenosine/S-adenosylhomocysteine deaminase
MSDKTPIDLRLDATWIVPVEPAGTLVDHTLIVDAGRIVDVLPAVQADERYAARASVALRDHVLIPGLVNAHTHAAMTLLRGIADDVPLHAWLTEHIWPREGEHVSGEFVHDGTLAAASEMLRGGITCANDMYFFPDMGARAYESTGMRAMIGMPVLDFPTRYAADADDYLQRGLAARDAFRQSPRLRFALAPHAPYTVGDATWRKVVTYARELDLAIHTHVAETAREVEEAQQASGESPVMRLDRLGATGPNLIAVHAVHLADTDRAILAAQGCNVVHCPASNMKLASGVAPIVDLARRGINVALGTDGAASNNRLDILAEMRLASLLAKVSASDAAALPAAEALRMATLGGAIALGLEADIGTLSAGKAADIVSVDLGGVDSAPVYDPVSHLVHVAGRECVSDVWIDGERVLEARRLVRIDEDDVLARVRAWRQRIST